MVCIYKFIPVKFTPIMYIRKAEARKTDKILRIHQTWVPLEKISPDFINAVLNAEDAGFFKHHGFDLNAIQMAYRSNKECGCIVTGGSTISQQTAKNVFCTHNRTWFRKAIEAYFTVLIEFIWGKERILEVYLNIIELGPGIFGVEEGAQYIFWDTNAQNLNSMQSQYLASKIPYPL